MKRAMIYAVCVMIFLTLSLTTVCTSSPNTSAVSAQQTQWIGTEPPEVINFMDNPPDGMYQGVGTAIAPTQNLSRQMAEARARLSLAQQITSGIENRILDYSAANELDPAMLQYMNTVTENLTKAELTQTRPVTRTYRVENRFESWSMMTMPEDLGNNAAIRAEAAARALAPGEEAAKRAVEDMKDSYARRNKPQIVRD